MSGSRLPGDTDGSDRHMSDVRAEARLDNKDGRNLALRFAAAVESSNHRSKAELVRKALDDYLPTEGYADRPRIRPPDDDELAAGFRALQRVSKHRNGTIPEDQALSVIAQESGLKTEVARLSVLKPLDKQGYISRRTSVRGRNSVRVMLPSDIPDLLEQTGQSGGSQ